VFILLALISAEAAETEEQRLKSRWESLVAGYRPLGVTVSPKVAAFLGPFGGGLQALSNIHKDEVLVSVPISSMVTDERLRKHYKTALRLSESGSPDWSLLAIFIGRIRSKVESHNTVSLEFRNVEINNIKWFPMCLSALSFDEALLAELPPWTVSDFRAAQDDVKREYQSLSDFTKEKIPYGISFDNFKEAVCMVRSRAFQLDVNLNAIVPFADKFNHKSADPDVLSYVNETHFWFSASKDLVAGQEIFSTYSYELFHL